MMTRRPATKTALALLFAAALLGCATYDLTVSQGNYLTFEHPFTDATADDVRKRAVVLCDKQVAVKTENVCNLTRCTTTYQCMSTEDATLFQKTK